MGEGKGAEQGPGVERENGKGGTQFARKDKNGKGVEGGNGELKVQRWRVHVWLGRERGALIDSRLCISRHNDWQRSKGLISYERGSVW